ncbi:FixH family protein [Aestuariibacter sp. AA17]|uniref:FixH family protein n=1 Tax=Fluctibacter corallii TaxID=2984329 RepID=A0ABT3A6G7_9ALTE|nr:FixH family protein [Aestuariibacter sp. AA17]MCV2884210.1 FixH family protein [Aestuariibacter sp. AA17]
MKELNTRPWYKQFWPWFLISIPFASVILSTTMMHLATNGQDTLVIDDYYKEGKGINLQLIKYQEAKVRGIKADLTVSSDSVALRFNAGAPDTAEALVLDFHHATIAKNDFELLLSKDASGNYRASLDRPITGKWRVTLHPLDTEWKITHKLTFPREDVIAFDPS